MRVRAHLRGKALGNSRGEISSYFVARARAMSRLFCARALHYARDHFASPIPP